MKHLLLTRFQGALIGANTIYITPQQIIPNQLIIDMTPAIMGGVRSLIRQGKFDIQDWTKNIFRDITNPERAIVAMLPLMLFFHDDRVKLRDTLINISHAWQLDWETCSSAVTIGYIISRSLTESLSREKIIPQLLDETINLHPLLFQELSALDRILDRASSLHQVTQRCTTILNPTIRATVLAIYCFLYTPEDFSLATRRANRIEDRSELICALTGILAGAHNSLTGIPIDGDIATQQRSQWLLAAESLLSSWAGVYHEGGASDSIELLPAGSQPLVAYPVAVAAPHVIQQRS
jgi:hypothetical protein